MPWKEMSVMDQKMGLVLALKNRGPRSVTEICEEWGVRTKTGYKWLHRYEADEENGLKERSRAPHRQARQVDEDIQNLILDLRLKEPRYGPKKLRAILEQQEPARRWPAHSTIAALLKREGLVAPRSRRPRRGTHIRLRTTSQESNQVWSADYKGWFRTRDGRRFEPLTIMDAHTRYLLRCQAVEQESYRLAKAIFEAAFLEYGLPQVIVTDNGAPFATIGFIGLSRLSVWWIRLGITPQRIEPGRPDQNGRHERMHLTLKQEAIFPIERNRRAQQARLDQFRDTYNNRRPHESLNQKTPASVYTPSPRPYPRRLPEPAYPDTFQVRRVEKSGSLVWKHRRFFLSHSLGKELVGLMNINDRYWQVYFGPLPLVILDCAQGRLLSTDRLDSLAKEGCSK